MSRSWSLRYGCSSTARASRGLWGRVRACGVGCGLVGGWADGGFRGRIGCESHGGMREDGAEGQ